MVTLSKLISDGHLWKASSRVEAPVSWCGYLHEWFSKPLDSVPSFPPLSILATLALSIFADEVAKTTEARKIIWLGTGSWINPQLLNWLAPPSVPKELVINHSIFINPKNNKELLISLESILRSAAACVVVATAPKLSFAWSKRIALAARRGSCTALLIRNYEEILLPSCAQTRWCVESRLTTESQSVMWRSTLLKTKGPQPQNKESFFSLPLVQTHNSLDELIQNRGEYEKVSISVSSELVDRSTVQKDAAQEDAKKRRAGSATGGTRAA